MTVTASTRTAVGNPRVSRTRWVAPRSLLIAAEIVVPVLLLAVWWIASASSTNTFFPPLRSIISRTYVLLQTPTFLGDIGSSLVNLLLSFVLAGVLGISLGLLLGLVRPIAWFIEPALHFFRAIPPVALVPIFVSLIGFGNETRIISITIAALFPTLIATLDGVRSVDPTLTMVVKVFHFPLTTRVLRAVLPAAGPRIFSGLEVSLVTAFVVMVASEMLGSSTGLGAATLLAQQSFMIADMWAGVLVLGVVGYLASLLFGLFRRRVLRWYVASQEQEKQ